MDSLSRVHSHVVEVPQTNHSTVKHTYKHTNELNTPLHYKVRPYTRIVNTPCHTKLKSLRTTQAS